MNDLHIEKLACSYFFVTPALAYGILSARLPAIRAMSGADESQMGILLLALGSATLLGLTLASLFIDRLGVKRILGASTLLLASAMTAASLAIGWLQLICCMILAGISVGFCDVAMNAQGIYIEQKHKVLCLSFLHAASGVGGVAGSLSGSLFSALGEAPFWNFALVMGFYLMFWPWAYRHTEASVISKDVSASSWKSLPFFILLCGVLSLFCHIAEGSAGEWGSMLLHSVKGASQHEAALVFAAFTGAMVICRFAADRLRLITGDFWLTFAGSLAGAAGMTLVLLSPWPGLCLAGYALMGLGLAPITPILFSRAGAWPGITPGRASGVVSVFSYAGLLFFPPFLGLPAQKAGLANALWIIVGCCLLLTLGSFALRGKKCHE